MFLVFCVSSQKIKKSYNERMPAAAPEDDDVAVHADADTEFLQPHYGLSHFSQLGPLPLSFLLTSPSV